MTKLFSLLLILAIPILFLVVAPAFAEEKKPEPQVTVSNINSDSFTVTWFTDEKVDQSVNFGPTDGLGAIVPDDRGKDTARLTHHVTLKGLTASKDYYFRIIEAGKIYRQKTAPALGSTIPPTPERFRGTIVTEDNLTPSEAIVYFKMGGGSLLTSPMHSDGTYEILTTNMRTANFNAYFKIEDLKYADFFIRSGFEGEAIRKVFGYARRDPIDFKLLAPRVPFYKIILPGFIDSAAEPASSGAPAAASQNAPTGNTQGFFGTIWERITSLF